MLFNFGCRLNTVRVHVLYTVHNCRRGLGYGRVAMNVLNIISSDEVGTEVWRGVDGVG
jgi:hypothetical protein